jgi:GNAT superfamily N-acetyltransferase
VTTVVAYATQHAADCARVLASVPQWFGRPAANAQYLADLAAHPSWVALDAGVPVGAITLVPQQPGCFEVQFLVVERSFHRRGIGATLLRAAEAAARERGGRWLLVKTLGASHADPNYARTRAFYLQQGFEPLFESARIWDERTPALVLVKSLAGTEAAARA